MAVRITKPEFNLRDKLSSLDGMIPVERMPVGSIIQTRTYSTSTEGTSTNATDYVSIGLYVDIIPHLEGSLLEVSAMIPNYSNNSNTNSWTNSFYLALYAELPQNTMTTSSVPYPNEERLAMFEHPGPKGDVAEFSQVVTPIYYHQAYTPGRYMFNWRVKMTIAGDTHTFGRNVDSGTTFMTTTVREIKQ